MIRNNANNTITFIDDDDFCNFAVNKNMQLIPCEIEGQCYSDWIYSDAYLDAIAAKTEMLMRDCKSRTLKNNVAEYKGITKPLECQMSLDYEYIAPKRISKKCKKSKCSKKSK